MIVSREIVSPGAEGFALFFVVIFTARSAVFIWGETDVIVPWMIVPLWKKPVSMWHLTGRLERGDGLVVAFI